MPTDPKAPPRVKDPALLRRLKVRWREFGCAHCGRRVTSDPLPGCDVELHHIVKRSQGGSDEESNILGLCGEIAGCRAHLFVERNRWKVARLDGDLWLTSLEFEPRRLRTLDG